MLLFFTCPRCGHRFQAWRSALDPERVQIISSKSAPITIDLEPETQPDGTIVYCAPLPTSVVLSLNATDR